MLRNQTANELAVALRESIDGEVRFDTGSRALYATDGSLYRQVPVGVVLPRSRDDVIKTIALCRQADAPVLPRGAGTSLAGQCCNVAVVIDFSKYLNRILELDTERRRARVEPGCVLDDLRNAAEAHHLTFGPDPSTHAHNTLGGMIGNNSCGVHSVMSGRTADNIHALEVATYDGEQFRVGATDERELTAIMAGGGRRGEIYGALKTVRDRYSELIRQRYPDMPRRVSGYNLDELLPENGFQVARALVGTEGTCATFLEAEVNLIDSPPHRSLVILGYKNVYACADHVMEIMTHRPTGLEGLDNVLIREMHLKRVHPQARNELPPGEGWLLVEFGGNSEEEARHKAEGLVARLKSGADAPGSLVVVDPEAQKRFWAVRESGLAATSRSPALGDTHPGWEDAAVPPENLSAYLPAFRELMHKYDYEAALYGHFGDGCVHCRINFDFGSKAGVSNWRAFMEEATELVLRHKGSLSGEHGDGQVRAELLPRMYGEELMQAFRDFKSIWDPRGRMNPGKVVDPYPMTENLRVGPETQPPLIPTVYDYADDKHSFFSATNRCVGVGSCRNHRGGVMCPSYRVTGDEQHSTRGRARLLFEMAVGGEISDGWRSSAVHDALDLCLSCKGCKQDCPVGVDMATYKSEFMFHHYRKRLRPRLAYSMGLIWWWSRAASRLPRVTNALTHAPGLSALIKLAGGIAQERDIPRFASETFRDWFSRRERHNAGLPQVTLWPDTFNNFFHPEILQAAVRVLEDAGTEVLVPATPMCCGRPLYAEGMLGQARRQLRAILDGLADEMAQGIPVVGLEPSCVASFRDELPQLFSGDPRAQYLAENTFMLGEFLHARGWQPPKMEGEVLVHLHCHQHASLETDSESALLEGMGLKSRVLDAGCCGMAGPFGFSSAHYEIAQRIGERELLPAMREAADDTLLVTNGFSCREQILQATGRGTLNLAEVLDRALSQQARRERSASGQHTSNRS